MTQLAPVIDIATLRHRRRALLDAKAEVRQRCQTFNADPDIVCRSCCRSWHVTVVDLADADAYLTARLLAVVRDRSRREFERLMRPSYGR